MHTTQGLFDAAPHQLVEELARDYMTHHAARRFDRACELAQLLTQMRPKEPVYWAALAVTHRALGRRIPALDAIRRALERDPLDREHALFMGELLCETGEPVEGLALIRAVFDEGRDPDREPAHQDALTRRAGAIIEAVQKSLELIRAQHSQVP